VAVIVALVKVTSVTVALHFGFGQDPAGAVGAKVVTSKLALPFLTSMPDWVPVTVVVKVCPGATLPAGLVHVTDTALGVQISWPVLHELLVGVGKLAGRERFANAGFHYYASRHPTIPRE
jgi:hypothetical protein